MCSLNASHASPVSELGEALHHELATAIELDGLPVAFVAADTLLEFVFVEERHTCAKIVFPLFMASGWPLKGYCAEVLIGIF